MKKNQNYSVAIEVLESQTLKLEKSGYKVEAKQSRNILNKLLRRMRKQEKEAAAAAAETKKDKK